MNALKQLACVVALAATACPAEPSFPGDEVIATFDFEDKLVTDGCRYELGYDGGEPIGQFIGTVSQISRSGEAYLTVGAFSHQGTLEGGRLSVKSQARRDLPSPCNCPGTVSERVEGQLYGDEIRSCAALEGLDGGAPVQSRPDGGVALIRRICGHVSDEMSALDNASCRCDPCVYVFSLEGARQSQ